MEEVEQSTKKKLTLSVDEKVVDKAKELGLNLSEVTESVLRGFAFAPDKTEKEVLYDKYKELFESMLPLLKEYDASVKVAIESLFDGKNNYQGSVDTYLSPDGTFWLEMFEQSFDDIHRISSYNLFEPKEILSNFITAIADAKEKRKERLEELEMARRIISVITDTTRKPKLSLAKKGVEKEDVKA